ncbi:MAG: VWA domain-containing protein [Planctomycetota bacterium]
MNVLDHFVLPQAAPFLLVPALLWLADWSLERRRAARRRGALGPRAPRLTTEVSPRRRHLRRAAWTAALACSVLAAMQPRWGEGEPITQRGVDIVVCLDLSRSMQARDLPPNRLACAQRELRALAARARGDRLALVVFAGEAHTYVPLTLDVDSFARLADLAHTLPALRGGTDLGQALGVASRTLIGGGSGEAIVVLTDGEDHAGQGLRAAQACAARGIVVHCVGFGSELGSKVPVGEPGHETWLRDGTGQDVVSAMDATSLRRLTASGGGEFAVASPQGGTLADLYDRRIRAMARKAVAAAQLSARRNRFQWPLLAAMLLWLAELTLGERRRVRP